MCNCQPCGNNVFNPWTIFFAYQEKIMTALADIQAAEASIATAVTAAVAAIAALSQKVADMGDSVSAADAETIVTELNTLAGNLNAAVTPPVAPAA